MKADAVVELVPVVGTAGACRVMEVARSTHYRRRRPRLVPEPKPRLDLPRFGGRSSTKLTHQRGRGG